MGFPHTIDADTGGITSIDILKRTISTVDGFSLVAVMKYRSWISSISRKCAKNTENHGEHGDGKDIEKKFTGTQKYHSRGNEILLAEEQLFRHCGIDSEKEILHDVEAEVSAIKSHTRPLDLSSKRSNSDSLQKSKHHRRSFMKGFRAIAISARRQCEKNDKVEYPESVTPGEVVEPFSFQDYRRKQLESDPKSPITIIISPPEDESGNGDSSSGASSGASVSSSSSTEPFDTTRLMPPSAHAVYLQRQLQFNEATEIKSWLIECMNRKANILPRELIYRMMEIYRIHEDELDPKMVAKLREGIEDKGVALDVKDKVEKLVEAPGAVKAIRSLKPSSKPPAPATSVAQSLPALFSNMAATKKRTELRSRVSSVPKIPKITIPEPQPWKQIPTSRKPDPSFDFPPYRKPITRPNPAQIYNPDLAKKATSTPNLLLSKSTISRTHYSTRSQAPVPRLCSVPSLYYY